MGLGPSISSVIAKSPSYSGPSYPSSPVLLLMIIIIIMIIMIIIIMIMIESEAQKAAVPSLSKFSVLQGAKST